MTSSPMGYHFYGLRDVEFRFERAKREVIRAKKRILRDAIALLKNENDWHEALSYNWLPLPPSFPTDRPDPKQYQKQERDYQRKLNVANLLFDTLGIPEPGLIDISNIIHVLKCLLLQLLFRNFSVFPGTIRPRCTTMPWSIWPALVVLWGVCWMFNPPQPDKQSENGRTLHSEIESSQQDLDFWPNRESNPIEIDSGSNQSMQQHFTSFEDYFQDLHHLTESSWSFPLTENQLITGDVPMDVPSMGTEFMTNCPAITFEVAQVLRQAEHRSDANDDNYEFYNMPLHLEPEVRESLRIYGGQDVYVASATSLASAGSSNVSTTQMVSNENTKLLNQIVFTATEENVEYTISDRNNPKSRTSKTQDKQLKIHNHRFPCDVEGCNLTFSRQYELDRHKKDVHGEGQGFPCPEIGCKFSKHGPQGPFGRKDKLKDHINNVHPNIDLAFVPGLQQPLRPTAHSAADKKMAEDKPKPQSSTITQPRKRGRVAFVESDSSEAQESSDTEVKRLRGMLEELKDENRQMKDRHERETEDLKDQNRWLRKMFEDVMKRTGG